MILLIFILLYFLLVLVTIVLSILLLAHDRNDTESAACDATNLQACRHGTQHDRCDDGLDHCRLTIDCLHRPCITTLEALRQEYHPGCYTKER